MIRGVPAQFKFKLPYSKDELEWIRIKFWQEGNPSTLLPITRTIEDCNESAPKELCVVLDEYDTLRFSDKYKARVQLRAMSNSGSIFGSQQYLITVDPMLDDIVEEDPTLPPEEEEGGVILDGSTIGD